MSISRHFDMVWRGKKGSDGLGHVGLEGMAENDTWSSMLAEKLSQMPVSFGRGQSNIRNRTGRGDTVRPYNTYCTLPGSRVPARMLRLLRVPSMYLPRSHAWRAVVTWIASCSRAGTWGSITIWAGLVRAVLWLAWTYCATSILGQYGPLPVELYGQCHSMVAS